MTEAEARQVLLLQAQESAGPGAHWGVDDRAWATRQALATVGEGAAPERFVVARAVIAMQRLLPRDGGARRWLARRAWHPAWVALAVVLGAVFGLAADQLGPPQRVNLLAPAVWAVVAWNLFVYAALLLPLPTLGLRELLLRWRRGGKDDADGGVNGLWWRHAAPLAGARLALVLHGAAAALALGLIAGLYLRGLVLDYRAGWQSTFLDAPAVQSLLDTLLAPAAALLQVKVADVTALRVAPGADATATAAPWIHLYATTLALFVVLPRTVLALWAAARAARRARHFPLPLDTPYFEALHPLMRPGLPRSLRLLWATAHAPTGLLGCEAPLPEAPLTLLVSEEGDELQLLPLPPELSGTRAATEPPPWWAPWRESDAARALARLQAAVDAVLVDADAPRPPWLVELGAPVVALPLHDLAEGWLPDGRLFTALAAALPGDPRLPRLRAAWTARQQRRFDALVDELAATLARVACTHEAVADERVLMSRRAEADAARQLLVERLDVELRAHGARLAALLGLQAAANDDPHTVPAAAAALRGRVGEGRAALVGGVLSGALAGLKADLLSGGLTMGAGAVAGGLIGALGAAGAARGLNVVRGTDRSYVAWNEEALLPVGQALLARALTLVWTLPPEAARERAAAALGVQQGTLATLWRSRGRRYDNAGEAEALAASLHRPLADALRAALEPPPGPSR
jgi:hypothetical protein